MSHMKDLFLDTQILLNNLTIQKQMSKEEFIAEVYEIAFGENAINRGFSFDEVIEELREFSDNALAFEESGLTREELEEIGENREQSYRDILSDCNVPVITKLSENALLLLSILPFEKSLACL